MEDYGGDNDGGGGGAHDGEYGANDGEQGEQTQPKINSKRRKSHASHQGPHVNKGIRDKLVHLTPAEKADVNYQKWYTKTVVGKDIDELRGTEQALQKRIASGRCDRDQLGQCKMYLNNLKTIIADMEEA